MKYDEKLEEIFNKRLQKKLVEIGELVSEKAKTVLEANLGKQTRLTEDIGYEVRENEVVIYADNKILGYIERGTKPHKIRAKNGKALAFRATQNATYKNGKKIEFGDKVVVQEVNHPGTDPRPFMSIALLLSKNEIKKIMQK